MHRFFQMWQQTSQGKNDLFVWTAETAGIGNHNDGFGTPPSDTHQGGLAMGFYNMNTGDAPYFKQMADHYAISDNYHQAIMGGTGANFLAIATGDAGYYTDASGNPAVPPTSFVFFGANTSQVENPNPQPASIAGTNTNWYTEDGYRGGSFVNCADSNQPGVSAIGGFLAQNHVNPNCAPGHYYLVNNYNLGYKANGTLNTDNTPASPSFTLPPLPGTLPTIADALSANNVTWKWYSGGRGNGNSPSADYCGICDPFTGFTTIMTDPTKRANLQDVNNLFADIAADQVPSVAFVRPPEIMAGHPANATLALYENFVTNLVNMVHDKPELWSKTAILITVDEGGGYYDSGYIQPVDFFGDGTRIPLIAVSPYAKQGYVDHTYYDHASILKFIEKNWGLAPLSSRSRDNLPNPDQHRDSYKPTNIPAIGDLMNLFDFRDFRDDAPAVRIDVGASK
jgi:phospholipase C